MLRPNGLSPEHRGHNTSPHSYSAHRGQLAGPAPGAFGFVGFASLGWIGEA